MHAKFESSHSILDLIRNDAFLWVLLVLGKRGHPGQDDAFEGLSDPFFLSLLVQVDPSTQCAITIRDASSDQLR